MTRKVPSQLLGCCDCSRRTQTPPRKALAQHHATRLGGNSPEGLLAGAGQGRGVFPGGAKSLDVEKLAAKAAVALRRKERPLVNY